MLLTATSKRNIDLAFERAARATLPKAADSCDIQPERASNQHTDSTQVLVITISSFSFRLMTLFRLPDNPAVRAYYVNDAVQTLIEVFAETANLCCGLLSGELARSVAHIGISIPYELSGSCIAYLGELQPAHLSSFAVTINDSVRLHVTLCMSCSVPVEFDYHSEAAVERHGDLELF